MNHLEIFSLKDVAKKLNAKCWQISFIYESGKLDEPQKVGGKRIFTKEDIDKIANLLNKGVIHEQN